MRFYTLFLLLTVSVFAQSYEEFLRSQEEAFTSFKEERDREFSEFLNKEWKAYKAAQGIKAYEEDKPLRFPQADKTLSRRIQKPVRIEKQPEVKVEQDRFNKIDIPSVRKGEKSVELKFFGVDLQIHYTSSILLSCTQDISKETIAQNWKQLANSRYEVTIGELEEIGNRLRLNDWARYLLIKEFSSKLYQDENNARVFTWFTLLKMGYDARVGYLKDKLILLLPIEGSLYNTVYYTLNQKKYYAIDYYAKGEIGAIRTYRDVYEGASKKLAFTLERLPGFALEEVHKQFQFTLEGKSVPVDLFYDENLLKFFQSYPQVGYSDYLTAVESSLLYESLRSAFEPLVVGKSQGEALDILLSFVQTAFEYKVDEAQFGKEKVMFPSETLFYPYSDCEDRVILFALMVKSLLGMDIVGVKYPNHMAAAVKIDEKIDGEYVSVGEDHYIIADPTYTNAHVGISMPQFKKTRNYSIISAGGEK